MLEKCLSSAAGSAGLPDALNELDRLLSLCGRDVLHRVSSRLETALLDRAMMQCGGSVLLRELLSICVVKFYSLDSSSVDRSYKVCLAHMNGEAVASSAGAAGGAGGAPVPEHKESVKVAATCVFGALAIRFGQQFIMSMTDVINTLCKLVRRRTPSCFVCYCSASLTLVIRWWLWVVLVVVVVVVVVDWADSA